MREKKTELRDIDFFFLHKHNTEVMWDTPSMVTQNTLAAPLQHTSNHPEHQE